MTIFLTLTLLLTVSLEAENGEKPCSPKDVVAVMHSLLVQKDFQELYKIHCHKHLRDQIGEKEFIKFMKSKRGTAIANLFTEVHDAIKQKKGEDILIAQLQDEPDEYEFILVQVKKRRSRKGQQWHLELKKEDDKWKLMDTD